MRFGKMPTSPEQKRDLLMIYTRYKRITIGSFKNSHHKINLPKMHYIIYL